VVDDGGEPEHWTSEGGITPVPAATTKPLRVGREGMHRGSHRRRRPMIEHGRDSVPATIAAVAGQISLFAVLPPDKPILACP